MADSVIEALVRKLIIPQMPGQELGNPLGGMLGGESDPILGMLGVQPRSHKRFAPDGGDIGGMFLRGIGSAVLPTGKAPMHGMKPMI